MRRWDDSLIISLDDSLMRRWDDSLMRRWDDSLMKYKMNEKLVLLFNEKLGWLLDDSWMTLGWLFPSVNDLSHVFTTSGITLCNLQIMYLFEQEATYFYTLLRIKFKMYAFRVLCTVSEFLICFQFYAVALFYNLIFLFYIREYQNIICLWNSPIYLLYLY